MRVTTCTAPFLSVFDFRTVAQQQQQQQKSPEGAHLPRAGAGRIGFDWLINCTVFINFRSNERSNTAHGRYGVIFQTRNLHRASRHRVMNAVARER